MESHAFERILSLCSNRNNDIRKEAMFCICNAVTGADPQLRGKIYNSTSGQILQILINGSNFTDLKLILALLDAIEDILKLDDWLGYRNSEHAIYLMFERM